MFLPPDQSAELVHFAALSDREVRSDLIYGFIATEVDYTSNLTSAFRRNVNAYTRTGLRATSFVLPPRIEHQRGCDATIILTHGGQSKIALLEAKWPRVTQPYYVWDYAQTASGLSHFSDQLQRQAKVLDKFAVFEIFYCEAPFGAQPRNMKAMGSTCVWHQVAKEFDDTRPAAKPPWTHSDLLGLLSRGSHTLEEMLAALALCEQGVPIPISGSGDAIAGEFGLDGLILQIATG